MRVLVLGGDGFCGWPTSLYLSDSGHDVTILDNLSRRKIDIELEVESLTPILPIGQRLRAWKEVSGREIGFVNLDIATEYDRLVEVLRRHGDTNLDSLVLVVMDELSRWTHGAPAHDDATLVLVRAT